MVNLFGGEIVRDNFSIALNAHKGTDNGVRLLIGKNITEIQTTADITSLVTRIVPLGFDGLMLPEIYVDSPLINNYPTPKIAKVDFNDIKYDPTGEDGYADINDAYTAMRTRAAALFSAGLDLPQMNIKVDWIELSKVEEYRQTYADLERVVLRDFVTVSLMGYNYTTEVKKVVYNVLTDMTERFEIGTLNGTIATGIKAAVQSAENNVAVSILDTARENATSLITSAMGGYVYKTDSELFIMDSPDPETAVNVWRWNLNGLGFSQSGISGPYETAITMDGQIVADFITTGTLSTSVIDGLDQIVLRIANNEDEINKFNTYFTFSDNGLTIGKSGSDYTNVLDNQGMTVSYQGNAVLTANNEGVHANAFVVDNAWNIDTLDNNGYVLGFWRKV
jgi:phage-related protein